MAEQVFKNGNGDQLVVKVPLEAWIQDIAKEGACHALKEFHKSRQQTCPVKGGMEKRLVGLQTRLYVLIGVLAGLGVVNILALIK